MSWDPKQYNRFERDRSRPGLDLLGALRDMAPDLSPARIIDLGCGSGGLTRRLADHWPEASVTGLDSSDSMLAVARAAPSRIDWVTGDIGHWQPDAAVDLIFSNAALQWVPEHEELLPRLFRSLAPGGVLAVQVPGNFNAPSHQIMRDLAADSPWSARLDGVLRSEPVLSPTACWRLLSPLTRALEIWETTYLHALDGVDPVLEWVRGTGLLPVLAALDSDQGAAFTAVYAEALRQAYPPEQDGRTLFPFRRLFLLARRTA
jgi:trans-aconitate 2-methyltransferase